MYDRNSYQLERWRIEIPTFQSSPTNYPLEMDGTAFTGSLGFQRVNLEAIPGLEPPEERSFPSGSARRNGFTSAMMYKYPACWPVVVRRFPRRRGKYVRGIDRGRGKRSKHSFPPRSRENSPWPDLTRVKCQPKCPLSPVNRSSERISSSPLETGRVLLARNYPSLGIKRKVVSFARIWKKKKKKISFSFEKYGQAV